MFLLHNKKDGYNDLIVKYIKISDDQNMIKKYIPNRYPIDMNVRIHSLNSTDDLLERTRKITLLNISTTGIGFRTALSLDFDKFYEISIEIYNKEVITSVIKIVRENHSLYDDSYFEYGARFYGLSDRAKNIINTYGILSEEKQV